MITLCNSKFNYLMIFQIYFFFYLFIINNIFIFYINFTLYGFETNLIIFNQISIKLSLKKSLKFFNSLKNNEILMKYQVFFYF